MSVWYRSGYENLPNVEKQWYCMVLYYTFKLNVPSRPYFIVGYCDQCYGSPHTSRPRSEKKSSIANQYACHCQQQSFGYWVFEITVLAICYANITCDACHLMTRLLNLYDISNITENVVYFSSWERMC